MGWRERDWAKWTDAERRRYYGSKSSPYATPTTPGSYVPPSTPLTPAEHGNRVRAVVWSTVAVAVVGVGGLGWSQRKPVIHYSAAPPPPAVVYGTSVSAIEVCVNELLDPQSHQWRCLVDQIVDSGSRVVAPAPAADVCDHVVADQSRGAWVCVASTPTP